jgi:hypothetical protein
MAIYRKGDDLTSLQNAATEQKATRKAASAEERGEAGLGGGNQPRVSNLLVDNSSGTPKAFEYDYRGAKGKDGKPGKVYRTDVKVSGGAVAAHEEKRERLGRQEAPVKVDRDRKVSKPKGKAPVKVVREMLGKGRLTIDQAAKLNKKGLSSPIKKKK